MRRVLPILVAAALLGGAAQAKDSPNAMAAGKDAVAQQPTTKMLMVCDEDYLSWRAFSRDLGTPDYVTAEQVRADTSKAWAAPKCITESQLRRLTGARADRLTAARAAITK